MRNEVSIEGRPPQEVDRQLNVRRGRELAPLACLDQQQPEGLTAALGELRMQALQLRIAFSGIHEGRQQARVRLTVEKTLKGGEEFDQTAA